MNYKEFINNLSDEQFTFFLAWKKEHERRILLNCKLVNNKIEYK